MQSEKAAAKEDRSGLNPETNTPHRLRLGDVLASIELSPGEVSVFLAYLAQQFLGGAHHNMGLALRDHAALASNPETYGYKVADAPATPGVVAYEAPTTPRYAESFGGSPREARRDDVTASPTPAGASPGIAAADTERQQREAAFRETERQRERTADADPFPAASA